MVPEQHGADALALEPRLRVAQADAGVETRRDPVEARTLEQVIDLNHGAADGLPHALDQLPKLSTVARPRQGRQQGQGRSAEAPRRGPVSGRNGAQAMGRQRGNVLATPAQRRNVHAELRQSLIEVGAQLAFSDLVVDVGIDRRHQPDVEIHDLPPAAADLDFAIAKQPGQPGLRARRHLGQVGQQEGPAAGGHQRTGRPDALERGAGVGGPVLPGDAKQATIQFGRRRGAIHLGERPPRGVLTQLVKRARHELPTAAAFATQAGARPGAGIRAQSVHHVPHGGRPIEHRLASLVGQRHVDAASIAQVRQHHRDVMRFERPRQHVDHTDRQVVSRNHWMMRIEHQDDRQIGTLRAERPDPDERRPAGRQVGHARLEWLSGREAQRLGQVARRRHRQACLGERMADLGSVALG